MNCDDFLPVELSYIIINIMEPLLKLTENNLVCQHWLLMRNYGCQKNLNK